MRGVERSERYYVICCISICNIQYIYIEWKRVIDGKLLEQMFGKLRFWRWERDESHVALVEQLFAFSNVKYAHSHYKTSVWHNASFCAFFALDRTNFWCFLSNICCIIFFLLCLSENKRIIIHMIYGGYRMFVRVYCYNREQMFWQRQRHTQIYHIYITIHTIYQNIAQFHINLYKISLYTK